MFHVMQSKNEKNKKAWSTKVKADLALHTNNGVLDNVDHHYIMRYRYCQWFADYNSIEPALMISQLH